MCNSIFHNLTELDQKLIDNHRVYYGQKGKITIEPFCSLELFLAEWSKHKETLFKMFGNQFILKKEIEITQSYEELVNILERERCKYDNIYEGFVKAFRAELKRVYENFDSDTYWYLYYELLANCNIINGKITNLTTNLVLANAEGKKITLNNGMKVMKAVSKVIDLYNFSDITDSFEKFRIACSQLLNQKTVKGIACISIHPLDYMTMSDNQSDWGSCMSWEDDGCYRRGTVEMMNSPLVVVGYLKSENDMQLKSSNYVHSWNNKKWRELFVVDDAMITGIKGYPYANSDLETIFITWLRDLAKANLNREYSDTVYTYPYGKVYTLTNDTNPNVGLDTAQEVRVHCTTIDMYNDFGTTKDSVHQGVFNLNNCTTHNDAYNCYQITCHYSSGATCLNCGCIGIEGDESYLLCENCGEGTIYCGECGDRLHPDEVCYLPDGSPVCESCYGDLIYYDPITDNDEWYENSSRFMISFLPKKLGFHFDLFDAPDEVKEWVRTNFDTDNRYFPISYQIDSVDRVWNEYPEHWARYFTRKPEEIETSYSREDVVYIEDMNPGWANIFLSNSGMWDSETRNKICHYYFGKNPLY